MESHQLELWPCHLSPLPDELLSCWLLRIAHGHHLKIQTFCDQVFGKQNQLWNRDIDRLAPPWLLSRLSKRTGTSVLRVAETTISSYQNLLFNKIRRSGIQQWVLPLELWHRKYLGFGIQFCPLCLQDDEEPYFRKRWRLALYTVCSIHKVKLCDHCPSCGTGVAFHRNDQGKYGSYAGNSITCCHQCNFDLRNINSEPPKFYTEFIQDLTYQCAETFEGEGENQFDLNFYNVLHHICKLITATSKHNHFHGYLSNQINAPFVAMQAGRICLEERNFTERHHILQLGMQVMTDPSSIIADAWRNKAIRYNFLKKDFDSMPLWYMQIIDGCKDWRKTLPGQL